MADYERPYACPTVIDPSPSVPFLSGDSSRLQTAPPTVGKYSFIRERNVRTNKSEGEFGDGRKDSKTWYWSQSFFFLLFVFSVTELDVFWVMPLDNLSCNPRTIHDRELSLLLFPSIHFPETLQLRIRMVDQELSLTHTCILRRVIIVVKWCDSHRS